jgi:hypothetical protein
MPDETFPGTLRIRDTRIYDDIGGGGQRIYTTAGQGYTKVGYIRADLVAERDAEIERLRAHIEKGKALADALAADRHEGEMTGQMHEAISDTLAYLRGEKP